jgi:xyloglucan 6-xylosyltransferase
MQILSQTNGLPAAAAAFSLRRRKSSVLIVSAIQPTPCRSDKGDHFNLLATKNKQDYARLHGYDFYLSNSLSDQRLSGAWNKVALIRDLLHWTDYEWLVWADYDALFMDVQFQIPFDKYEGRDFIVWGQHRQLFVNGDAHMGKYMIFMI